MTNTGYFSIVLPLDTNYMGFALMNESLPYDIVAAATTAVEARYGRTTFKIIKTSVNEQTHLSSAVIRLGKGEEIGSVRPFIVFLNSDGSVHEFTMELPRDEIQRRLQGFDPEE